VLGKIPKKAAVAAAAAAAAGVDADDIVDAEAAAVAANATDAAAANPDDGDDEDAGGDGSYRVMFRLDAAGNARALELLDATARHVTINVFNCNFIFLCIKRLAF